MKKKTQLSMMSAYQLIEELERQHPAACIQVGEHETMAHRRGGARELIDSLTQRKGKEENG